jgi:hypothetical protein
MQGVEAATRQQPLWDSRTPEEAAEFWKAQFGRKQEDAAAAQEEEEGTSYAAKPTVP